MSVNVDIRNLSTRTFGGSGGSLFLQTGIQSLALRSGKYVDAIIINGTSYGGPGGTITKTITFAADEYISRIEIRKGVYVDQLEITTNKGQSIQGGGRGGSASTVEGMIVSLGGRSGVLLDRIDTLVVSRST